MKNFLNEITALKFTPWYRWHPQIAMRYLPAAERINGLKRTVLSGRKGQSFLVFKVLEVGSGGLGIAPYLKMPVTGVDKEFEPPFHPLLKKIKGGATNLKFENNSFDAVISMDMLEHLPKEKRRKAVEEMMRVARKLVVIGVPSGKEAEKQDKEIKEMARLPRGRTGRYIPRNDEGRGSRNDRGFEFLQEQVEYGLPEEADILKFIKSAGKRLKKQVNIEVKGNMNLKLRRFLMRGWMSKNVFVNILFRKVFLLLIPVFRVMDREPYYRKIFFVEVKRY